MDIELIQQWIDAKADEKRAQEHRRAIEDELSSFLEFDKSSEKTHTYAPEGYKVKVAVRLNRRIDGDKLQEIASENGLSEHLGTLFRWKPDINAKEWANADESITRPLLDAITTQPGRPSFTITKEEK